VMNTVAGIVGAMQANEAIKVILGLPSLIGKMLVMDLKTMRMTLIKMNSEESREIAAPI